MVGRSTRSGRSICYESQSCTTEEVERCKSYTTQRRTRRPALRLPALQGQAQTQMVMVMLMVMVMVMVMLLQKEQRRWVDCISIESEVKKEATAF